MKFILELTLGNDAMRTNHHVAQALAEVAARIKNKAGIPRELQAKIFDQNGNSVGSWRLEKS
jgi:hypothetical protein